MEEIDKLRLQLQSLKQEMKVLRETHEITTLQLAESRENEQKYKKLNDTLVKGLESNQGNGQPQEIRLHIQGEFGCQRCIDLENELESYRTGVNFSVERRVKEIAKNISNLQEEDRRKSRISYSRINNNYHIQSRDCQNCAKMEKETAAQMEHIKEALSQYEEKVNDRDILAAKLKKMQALVQNLQEENAFLETEIEKLTELLEESQRKEERQYYEYSDRKSRVSMGKFNAQQDKSNKIMQEITNLVTNISHRKMQEDKRKSRVYQANDSALFSIKNGINRPGQGYY